jgi:glycosyltransferase involved in cell wall biosynthesis
MLSQPRKVALITGICVQHDAISASVRDDALAFSAAHGYSTRVYSYSNDYPELDAKIVAGPADILFDAHYRDADLLIYHFGIYHDLFNTIMVGNGHAPQAVRYHNITAREFLPQSDWGIIARSRRQLFNCRAADRIWPVSDYNAADLVQNGIATAADIEVIPLMVGNGARACSLLEKDSATTRIVFLGRFVKSKGLTDLLRAVAAARARTTQKIELRLLGSPKFSSRDYMAELTALTAQLHLGACVTMVGEVSEAGLADEFRRAHIICVPSYHEGFCKPVIEAMAFGCIPVTYDAGNLAFVARGYSRTVPAGDIAALATALTETSASIESLAAKGGQARVTVDAGEMPVATYEAECGRVLQAYGAPEVSAQLRRAGEGVLVKGRKQELLF